jgi:uncharacterized cupredoxin-like copper-binding protein
MTMRKLLLGGLALGLLAFGWLLSSGGLLALAHGEKEEAGEVIEVEILMGEMFFQVEGQAKNAPIVLEAGKTYELVFKNVGTVLHEAKFGKGLKTDDEGAPVGYEENLFEDVEVKIEGDMAGGEFEIEAEGLEEIEISPGDTLKVIVTLPEEKVGEWEIGCFVPGHYQAGMKAPLIVQ